MLRNLIIAAFGVVTAMVFGVLVDTAEAGVRCHDGTVARSAAGCPPPAAINGPVKSSERFKRECAWLPFPVGAVGKPIVFFTREGDDACLGKNWRSWCQDCVDWIHGKRGPVHGPARNARIVWRLHNGMTGVSVPRDRLARIRRDAGWCWFGKSGIYESHHFNERPF